MMPDPQVERTPAAVEVCGEHLMQVLTASLCLATDVPGALRKAAELIERNGWFREDFCDLEAASWVGAENAPLCAAGAIRLAATGYPDEENELSVQAEAAFTAYLICEFGLPIEGLADQDVIALWNDDPHRTAEQVVDALRATAEGVAR